MAQGDPGSIRVEGDGSAPWVLELHGEHDLSTVAAIHDRLAPIADRSEAAIIDLSQVTFIDSAVLTELIASRRGREEGGGARLAIVAPPGGFPARVLALLQLDRVVAVHESRGEALASFDPPPSGVAQPPPGPFTA
ncbi:MAG TPA: STAS domain-containing protein [Gaiellales bacterium]|nr:STAS domain-containing protein [Gaiellales bacterium]